MISKEEKMFRLRRERGILLINLTLGDQESEDRIEELEQLIQELEEDD